MVIHLGPIPLASGAVQSVQPYSDGTVRVAFALSSGKSASLTMTTEEARAMHAQLAAIFGG